MLTRDMSVSTSKTRADVRADASSASSAAPAEVPAVPTPGAADFAPTLVPARAPFATWRQMLPAHRLPVIAKTPFLVAVGWYVAGGQSVTPNLLLTLVLASGLWAALYIFNEATDLMIEQGLAVRRRFRASLLLVCAGLCLTAARLAPTLGLLFTTMTLGQLAYCMPSLRWKRHWAANVILSGGINPVLRLCCGAIWGLHVLPPFAYAVCIAAHLGACLRARALLRDRDRRLGYRPAPRGCEWIGLACVLFAVAGGAAACLLGWFPRFFLVFPAYALGFIVYAWSGRATNMATLRRNWIVFALIALAALVALLRRG